MYRIKDPKASLDFYTRIMGMELIKEQDCGDFTLYFLAFDHDEGLTKTDKAETAFSREGMLPHL
jgi:lactoylglutathione lyase